MEVTMLPEKAFQPRLLFLILFLKGLLPKSSNLTDLKRVLSDLEAFAHQLKTYDSIDKHIAWTSPWTLNSFLVLIIRLWDIEFTLLFQHT